jgi:hypothetical protein
MGKISEQTLSTRLAGDEDFLLARGATNGRARRPVITRHYKYAAQADDESALHQVAAAFAVGDLVTTDYFNGSNDPGSGPSLRVVEVRVSAYGGNVGTFTNGGATGPILEGLWHRFAVRLAGNKLDIKHCGIRCVETVTGWHTRFAEIIAYSKSMKVEITGSGVLSCTETVFLDRAYGDLSQLRFQGGTHAPNGATVGPSTFFTAAQANAVCTIAPGTPVVVTQTGHGFAANKEIMLGSTGKLPGGLAYLTKYFVRNPATDTFELSTTSGGASINSATAGNGTHYCFYSPSTAALPAQANITTQDILLWNGKVKRLGIIVRGGSNGSNKDLMRSRVVVWGDGNSDWTTPPSCIGIRHEADDSPNAEYEYVTNYCYIGTGIQGPSEKHSLTIRGIYSGIGAYLLNGSSADTLRVRLHLANVMQFYGEHHGVDTSVHVDMDCEGRDDPFSRTNNDMGTDLPAILIRNGKATTLSGECRSVNGINALWVGSQFSSSGTSKRYGTDTFTANNLRFVHGYGKFVFLSCRHMAGQIHVKDWANENTGGGATHALVYLGRINDAGGFQFSASDVVTTEGVHVGGSVVNNYYPYGAHLGRYAIQMGTLLSFNTDSDDGTAATERTGSSGFPTTLTAANLEKMKGGIIDLSGSKGNVTIGATVTDDATITVDREMRRYTITKNGSAVCDVGYPTLATAALTIV